MDIFFIGFVFIIIVLSILQAIRLYRTYKNTLYTAFFSNYFEYFYRYQFKQNLSNSHWLKQELGTHHILYNSFVDKNGHVTQTYVTLLCNRGVFVIRDMLSTGNFIGKENDKYWILHRTTNNESKKFKIPNPQLDLHKHIQYQEKQLHLQCDGILAFPQSSVFSKTSSNYILLHYNEIISYIIKQPQKYSDDQLLSAFNHALKKS